MRELVRRARARIRHVLDESPWIPLAGKAFGIGCALLLLSAIGAGIFDRTFDLGPPRAEAATSRRAPRKASRADEPATSAPRAPTSAASVASGSAATKPPAAPGKVILNEATATDLERLPGVGPAKAQAILALREKLGGRFKRIEDLLRVRGIKRRALQKIRDHVVLDAPPPDAPPDAPPAASASASAAPRMPPAAAPRSW